MDTPRFRWSSICFIHTEDGAGCEITCHSDEGACIRIVFESFDELKELAHTLAGFVDAEIAHAEREKGKGG